MIFYTGSSAGTNNDLFNIGIEVDKLKGAEKLFYDDQTSVRKFRLSEEIDLEYEEEKARAFNESMEDMELEQMERSYADPDEYREILSPTSAEKRSERYLRRRHEKPLFDNKETQTPSFEEDIQLFPRPSIRKTRNSSPRIKDAIATVSYRTALSVPMARVAFQAVCEKAYGHRYYLTPEEQLKFEPTLESIPEEPESAEPISKKPRSAEQYQQNYCNVIPSAKSCSSYKHTKALHQEMSAAKALQCIGLDDTRATLHFDTTRRSRIEGEWPSLILNFLNEEEEEKSKMIRLRPIFFAYEDRTQIARLIVETFKRLSVAGGNVCSAKELWEKIYAFMSDAVTKNLHVEDEVATVLESQHKPLHILCKSHTCEKLDASCIDALVEIEKNIDYAQLLCKRQPELKSFIRQTKCVALTALKAFLKLVARDESGKPTSLADEFDVQLEADGVSKTMSLYKNRRFVEQGYSAGAVVDCKAQFQKILNDRRSTNLLIQACKLYIESDYIFVALRALAYFTYKVTMPFLNCVEKCNQNQLMPILKKLHDDLQEGKMDTMSQYHVPWTHIDIDKIVPVSPLDHAVIKRMCQEAAKGVHMQCAREYWDDQEQQPRATQLFKLTESERKNIPTENLACERYLARFGSLAAVSAARSNKFFKATRIRDDLMFEKHIVKDEEVINKESKKIIEELKKMELDWTDSQKQRLKEKYRNSAQKNVRMTQYMDILVKKCKDHGGPLITIKEIQDLVKKISDPKKLKSCLRAEVGFQKAIHPFDAKERSHLYKMNFITVEEIVENLSILLEESSEISNKNEAVQFPCDEEILEKLQMPQDNQGVTKNKKCFSAQEPVAVLWDGDDGKRYWCLGFYICDEDDNHIKVDHLTRKENNNSEWIRPRSDDIQIVNHVQVISTNIEGYWDFSNERHPVYTVTNSQHVQEKFECL